MDSLCVHGSSSPSWVQEDPRGRGGNPTNSGLETLTEGRNESCQRTHKNRWAAFNMRDGGKEETGTTKKVHHKLAQEVKVTIASPKQQNFRHDTGIAADLVTSLKACGQHKDLGRGRLIHQDVVERGFLQWDVFVGSAVISMYAKCGAMDAAQEVFDELHVRNIVSWNALIAGYVQDGQSEKALCCFYQMQGNGFSPDAVTFACALKACGHIGALDKGRNIHVQIRRHALLERDTVVGTALVDMYGKCGELDRAREAFGKLMTRNVVSWNALISVLVQHGLDEEALEVFEEMRVEGCSPDAVTFISVLKACGNTGALEKGQDLHSQIIRERLLEKHIMSSNALIDMYVKCGVLDRAQDVFDQLPKRSIVSWTALISGYAQHGHGKEALCAFDQMQQSGVSPDAVIFVCVLKICGSLKALEKGQNVHAQIEKEHLLQKNATVANALINMYAKCGGLEKAQEVFYELPSRDRVSWNTLIGGYVDHGLGSKALSCFETMRLQGFSPNAITYACILRACGIIGSLEKGKEIHSQIEKEHLLGKHVMVGSALVDMYSKCGALEKAQEVFDRIPMRNTVVWNVLIAGYSQADRGEEALKWFEQMQRDGCCPNAVTFACILKACGNLGAVYKGQNIHAEIVRLGYSVKATVVGIELVVMYSRCGLLLEAQELFQTFPMRDAVTWSAMLVGCAQLGKDDVILKLFDKMLREGVVPNSVTFTIVLNACNHLGLLDKGELYFEIISKGYGIIPSVEHHTCMIDLFGRAGRIDAAVAAIEGIPLSPDLTMWLAVLGACQKLGHRELANWAFENAVLVHLDDAAAYVYMNNIYLHTGMQEMGLKV